MYGAAESWALTEAQGAQLETFHNGCLRQCFIIFSSFPLLFAFVVGGLGFEFCVFVAGWRHALRSEWLYYYYCHDDDDCRSLVPVLQG